MPWTGGPHDELPLPLCRVLSRLALPVRRPPVLLRSPMSADNWAVCPSCLAVAQETKAAQVRLAQESYGHVEVEEFDRLRTVASAPIDMHKLTTYREDYDFWMDGTVVHLSYDGGCSVCGTGVKFSDVRPIEMKRPKVVS